MISQHITLYSPFIVDLYSYLMKSPLFCLYLISIQNINSPSIFHYFFAIFCIHIPLIFHEHTIPLLNLLIFVYIHIFYFLYDIILSACTIYLIYIYTVYPITSPLFNGLIFDSILSIMDHQYSIIPLLISFIQISHEYSIIRFLDKLYIHINSAMSIYPVNGPLIYHPHLTPIVYIIFYYPFTFDFVYPYPIDIQLYI